MEVPHNTTTDFGNPEIIVKRIADSDTSKRVVNPHRDNYYIFCLLKRGDATFRVDFEEVAMTSGSVLCIRPDQIHACRACWECVDACPENVIGKVSSLWHRHAVIKRAEACIGCKKCIKACRHGVIVGN